MSDDLKPCPFCGGKASKTPDPSHSTGWEVGCFSGKCDVEPHVWAVHLETAMMQWNTRADKDRIEQLERERDEYFGLFVHWRKEADDLTEQLKAAEAKLANAVDMMNSLISMIQHAIGPGNDVFIEPDTGRKLSDAIATIENIKGA